MSENWNLAFLVEKCTIFLRIFLVKEKIGFFFDLSVFFGNLRKRKPIQFYRFTSDHLESGIFWCNGTKRDRMGTIEKIKAKKHL